MESSRATLAVLGGTGDLGGGLARRWARAGHRVLVGSRSAHKGEAAAQEIQGELGDEIEVRGMDNVGAAQAAEVAVLTVPFAHQEPILAAVRDALAGKILVDCTVPLVPPKVARVQLPAEGSAALRAQRLLGAEVRVVSAFQNVGAEHLRDEHPIDCDVLVAGDDPEARDLVVRLVEAAGLKGWHAGPLANSVAAEALTSVLIFINKRYRISGSGIRITEPTKSP